MSNRGKGKVESDVDCPLWKYVDRKDKMTTGGGNWAFICTFCKKEFKGSYTRVKAHLLHQVGVGIHKCNELDDATISALQKEEDDAQVRKTIWSSKSKHEVPLPNIKEYGTKKRRGDQSVDKCFNASARDQLDHMIARAMYANAIPFNVIRSPSMRDAFKFAAENNLKGYVPPTADRLRTTLLQYEKANIDSLLASVKNSWSRTGVSICSDGWTDNNRRPLINFIALSGNSPVFLKAIDTSGNYKDKSYMANLFLESIAEVGSSNVVQIITDNAPVCKSAGMIVENVHNNIFWTPCVVHTLNLALKNICSPTPGDEDQYMQCEWIKEIIEDGKMIKNFVTNHSHALAIYNNHADLKLLNTAETRFASHILVLERLQLVKKSLSNMVVDEHWKFLKEDDNKKAQLVKNIIVNDEWWEKVDYLMEITNPLMKMLRRCDSDQPALHLVYEMWDNMIEDVRLIIFNHERKNLHSDKSDFYTEIHAILVSRWTKSNTVLHCLAHSLNPKYYSDEWLVGGTSGLERAPPHRDPEISDFRLKAFKRLYPVATDRKKIMDEYGRFCSSSSLCLEAQKERFHMDPLTWWNNYGAHFPMLVALAERLLNQPSSSSSCERNWSTYSLIQTAKRNRLKSSTAEDLVYIHSNLRLLSRKEDSYKEGPTKYWDVGISDNNFEGPFEFEIENIMSFHPVLHPQSFQADTGEDPSE